MNEKLLCKPLSTLVLLFFAVPVLVGQVRGNGNVEKQERRVGSFSGISVRSGIDLIIKQGDRSTVIIETDENLQEYVVTEVESGILNIYVKQNTRIIKRAAMDAYVTVDQLDRLKVSGGGDVQSQGQISTEDLDMAVSGGGDLQFDLKANRVKCAVSGGGDVSLEAIVGELKAAVSGGGDLDCVGDIGTLELSMSGGGDASIKGDGAAGGVMASMTGGGDLDLEMDCEKIKVSSAGGGDVSANAGEEVSQASFSLNGGGDLSLEIGVSDLAISLGGGGDAELEGSAGKMAAEIKSGGDLEAPDFRVKAAKIELSGGSDASIHVEEELLLNAKGGAQIYLTGDPHIDANLTGGSKLHRR
jgi:hypothetical protein